MRVVSRTDTLIQTIFEDVHIMEWKRPLDFEGLESTLKIGLELTKTHPRGFWAMTIVTSGIAIPSLSLQRRASEVTRMVDPYLKGATVVLPGEGFWVSAARSFMVGLELVAPLKSKREIVSTVDEGCAVLARRSGRSESWAAALEAAVRASNQ